MIILIVLLYNTNKSNDSHYDNNDHIDTIQGQGALQEVEHCGTKQCGEGPAVDCEMETWGPWSACSASCDGGEMRCKSIKTPLKSHKK